MIRHLSMLSLFCRSRKLLAQSHNATIWYTMTVHLKQFVLKFKMFLCLSIRSHHFICEAYVWTMQYHFSFRTRILRMCLYMDFCAEDIYIHSVFFQHHKIDNVERQKKMKLKRQIFKALCLEHRKWHQQHWTNGEIHANISLLWKCSCAHPTANTQYLNGVMYVVVLCVFFFVRLLSSFFFPLNGLSVK